MENNTPTQASATEQARPHPFTRERSTETAYLLGRVLPANTPDDGVSPLDVAAFTSSI